MRLLGRLGGAGSIQALRDAWTEEPFWGVRIAMARALVDALDRHMDGDLIQALRDTLESLEAFVAKD